MPDNPITLSIPSLAGSYALVLKLDKPVRLEIGRLGCATFPSGIYVYTGSAFGSGGLRARISRHLRGDGKLHWHIDFLRRVAQPFAVYFTPAQAPGEGVECRWAQKLARLPQASIPLPGFGASDCRSGCRAHLVALPDFSPGELSGPPALWELLKADGPVNGQIILLR